MPFFRMNDTRLFEPLEKASDHDRIRINHQGYIFGGNGIADFIHMYQHV
ncbi:Uncharacterised protein [Klebsiella pneumoniae]|nr:Uncharacterised protein [Klebsiella pneumoniae]